MTALEEQPTTLSPREDRSLPARLALSAAATDRGAQMRTEEFDTWLKERADAYSFEVNQIPFHEMKGWFFNSETGNLAHQSGKFFSVEGLRVRSKDDQFPVWHQPIMNQPEVGILGILVKEIDGVLHCLMQAKMEPGNPGLIQLSPTVQATKSNYSQVHKGSPVRYLDYFAGKEGTRVIVDVLQSECGAWFYRKRNRNMFVEYDGDVEVDDDFCWLTLGQVNELVKRDNVVNMPARSVLSCLPQPEQDHSAQPDAFRAALAASRDPHKGALHANSEVLSWFTVERSTYDLDITRVPLYDVPHWQRTDKEIAREDGRFFRVIGVDVQAGSREVTGWSQPLFQPHGVGIAAFIVREFGGVLHVLAQARMEGGFIDVIELGPTVQCVPWNYQHVKAPLFLDTVLHADKSRIRYAAVHAEEGGRFYEAETRYLVVEADGEVSAEPPPGYAWVTVGQMTELLRHGQYVNSQARTLIACVNAIG
ncbi:NDP-hexose 2,3-dehydratase family protein [Nocardia sp. NRRL S-836]|uniref:NDP-hexose 2,3-dehydratase family protein n=1 Tax=Nocardia sp. NRRL S-836 TaxID=1519492 RepID=UPI000A783CEF|nr:NDP-hexose 2,3-dehydratase family protein [Nocardia sp. NRRL S-836]